MPSFRKITGWLVAAGFLLLAACSSSPTATALPQAAPTTAPAAAERVLVLGDITDDPAEVIEGTQPLADYLAAHLKELGVTAGKVRIARTTEEMIRLLADGEVDLYFDSVYPATLISDAAGAQIALRRWRYGVEEYQSVIFASQASGITRLDQLPGHLIAMDAPYSTSGFLLPAVLLLENDLTLIGKQSYEEAVNADEVGFVFSYDDENTMQWVLKGLAAAGVTDDYNFDHAFPAEATAQLVELDRTEYVPRQVMVARGGLEPALLQAIKRILIAMDEDDAGKAPLEAFQTTQFDEFPEGLVQATQRMREMSELVASIPLP